MRARCFNHKEKRFKDYGGRGITVCERWEDYENFLADMGECPDGMSIERRDNDGNYEPSNCNWATPAEQANNQRCTYYVTYEGERIAISLLAARHNICSNVVYERVAKYSWTVEAALKTPVTSRTPNLKFNYRGQELKLSDLVKIASVNRNTLYQRLTKCGWSVERAVETPVGSTRKAAA
jgi:hypothetical protein